MVVILIRTLIIYTILLIAMRLMGKRQIGQLEVTDLVTTFMLSEIATLPIENPDMPLIIATIPIVVLLTFEIVSSSILIKFPKFKNIFSSRPGFLIKNGKVIQSEMTKNRISPDELISELRQNGITDISEAEHVIIEPDGKLSVIPKVQFRPITPNDLHIKTNDTGLTHIVIFNGTINKHGLNSIKRDTAWLNDQLKKRSLGYKDVFLMTITDCGQIYFIEKEDATNNK